MWEHPPQVARALELYSSTPVHALDAGNGTATGLSTGMSSAGDSPASGGLNAFDYFSDGLLHDGEISSLTGSTHTVEGLISSHTRGRRAALTANSARGSESTGGPTYLPSRSNGRCR